MTITSAQARAELEAQHRPVTDKLVGTAEAVRLVRDGDHIAVGGTLYSRTPVALLFELLRARRSRLTLSRPLACHETELFLATGAADCVVASWVGIGLRWGLSPVLRHYMENGLARYDEWSHLALGLRYKAAAMGVPFLPTRTMLGSDLEARNAAQRVSCPYSGEDLLAIPALVPDVAILHVHRADIYGNVQVDGYRHMDVDMARAARRVIVSAEEIVSPDVIEATPGWWSRPRSAPTRTSATGGTRPTSLISMIMSRCSGGTDRTGRAAMSTAMCTHARTSPVFLTPRAGTGCGSSPGRHGC